ncbi:DUF1127 domain-containing protein [Yoonia sp. 208BN28-4]|uniref:DUF1127 domain-containing protein n=1 Tax=Yoonia sp. 208BN28-4 TaxID=3126505 RepID=UPI0030ADB69E
MASLPNSHIISNGEILLELLATPFRALGDMFTRAAERHPRFIAVEKINAMSDAELAAQGLTRADATRRALGIYF